MPWWQAPPALPWPHGGGLPSRPLSTFISVSKPRVLPRVDTGPQVREPAFSTSGPAAHSPHLCTCRFSHLAKNSPRRPRVPPTLGVHPDDCSGDPRPCHGASGRHQRRGDAARLLPLPAPHTRARRAEGRGPLPRPPSCWRGSPKLPCRARHFQCSCWRGKQVFPMGHSHLALTLTKDCLSSSPAQPRAGGGHGENWSSSPPPTPGLGWIRKMPIFLVPM